MSQATRHAGRVLLVDCNPDDEELTLRALKHADAADEVVVAHDGTQALDYLLAEGKFDADDPRPLPTVVLLDLRLPKLDGLEVLKRIRSDARTRVIPVVILTSSGEEEDLIRSYECGANSYVRKPVNFAEFTAVVGQLAAYWLVLNRLPRSVGKNLTQTVRSP
ncbi:MAG: response regulator [Burkholderiales bacterium]